MPIGVSPILRDVIKELMKEPVLSDFFLGGGTNLAIKYNHRVSVDIDLFSSGIVGANKMKAVESLLIQQYGQERNFEIDLENRQSENLSFVKCKINKNGEDIRIDIMQNIKMLYKPVITHDGIRLIDDLDIGSLKLLAAADRGEQKDFYDLYLLSEKHGLNNIYNVLKERHRLFVPGTDDNIFNIPTHKPKEDLKTDLSALGNFNKAADRSIPGNRVTFTDNSGINMALPILKDKWLSKVKALSHELGLRFNEPKKVALRQRKIR